MLIKYTGTTGLSLTYTVTSLAGMSEVASGSLTEAGTTGVYSANASVTTDGHYRVKIFWNTTAISSRPACISNGVDGSISSTPTTIGSSPEMALLAMRDHLVLLGLYVEGSADLGLILEPQPVPGSDWCRIRYNGLSPDIQNDGMGGFGIGAAGMAVVRCYMRKDVDSNQTDTRALSALYRKASRIVGLFQNWTPLDQAENGLVSEPIRFAGMARAGRYTKDRQFIYVDIEFEVHVEMASQSSAGATEC